MIYSSNYALLTRYSINCSIDLIKMLHMESLKEGMLVKYSGESNKWTYKNDLEINATGKVINIFKVDGFITYQVEFGNGIITSIEREYLEPKSFLFNEI